jgi:hypothetical protein
MKGGAKMKNVKDWILGIGIGGGIILILLGLQAVATGNKWWPAYFAAGAIIAAGFIKFAINDYSKEKIGAR